MTSVIINYLSAHYNYYYDNDLLVEYDQKTTEGTCTVYKLTTKIFGARTIPALGQNFMLAWSWSMQNVPDVMNYQVYCNCNPNQHNDPLIVLFKTIPLYDLYSNIYPAVKYEKLLNTDIYLINWVNHKTVIMVSHLCWLHRKGKYFL